MSAGTPREWDAATYDRISTPHLVWAGPVLDRLAPAGDERVLDAGCGTGRVTEMLLERLPEGEVVAVDASEAMCAKARANLGDRATVLHQDLLELALPQPVDAIVSTATFHWIVDHDRLFARLHEALRPGGRLVAQCGGRGNIAHLERLAAEVGERVPYAPYLGGWTWPKRMAGAEETEEALRRAGFAEARAWLEPSRIEPPDPHAFVGKICLRAHLDRLPEDLRDPFVTDVLDMLGEPVVLEYVRLNLEARRAG